jgi:hypothetical protein
MWHQEERLSTYSEAMEGGYAHLVSTQPLSSAGLLA